jgi:hypothetical protein
VFAVRQEHNPEFVDGKSRSPAVYHPVAIGTQHGDLGYARPNRLCPLFWWSFRKGVEMVHLGEILTESPVYFSEIESA